LWKLKPDDRLETNGSVERAVELEAYNIQLEKIYGGDHCHNIDRIMRLPGTVNLPTKKKAKKGRKPVEAELVRWRGEAVYEIDRFTPAVRVQVGAGGLGGGQPKVRVSGNVPDVGTEELQAWAEDKGKTIKDRTLALIATGADPV